MLVAGLAAVLFAALFLAVVRVGVLLEARDVLAAVVVIRFGLVVRDVDLLAGAFVADFDLEVVVRVLFAFGVAFAAVTRLAGVFALAVLV